EEVRDKVEERWRADQIAERLSKEAEAILAKLRDGATLEQVAKERNIQTQTAGDLQRGRAAGFLPATVVDAAFATPKGEIGSAEYRQENAYYIFRVTDVSASTLDPKSDEAKAIASTLQSAYADDLI